METDICQGKGQPRGIYRADNFYVYHGQVLDCPVPAVIPAVIMRPGITAHLTDYNIDCLSEELIGNGRIDYADVIQFFR